MIAKRIPSPKGGGRAAALVRYVVNAQGQVDPRSWTATAAYILDTAAAPNSEGEKVSAVRVTNCASDDPAGAAMEIEFTQGSYRGRGKAAKTYHLVFSFPSGERPEPAVLNDIEDALCKSIGLDGHQRISAVHIDRDHYHVHVAINTVSPDGARLITPSFDKRNLMRACEAMERRHGLQRTNHGLEQEPTHERHREPEGKPREREKGPDHPAAPRLRTRSLGERDSRFRRYLRECHDSILGGWGREAGDGLHDMSGGALVSDDPRSAVLVFDDARGGLVAGSAENADDLRWAGAGDRVVAGPADAGAGRVEAKSGIETLAGYVARELAPGLRDALTWQEVHDTLAAHGLQARKRGAGLVIGDEGLGIWCKASSTDRGLSLSALERVLGPYEHGSRQERRAAPGKGYRAEPMTAGGRASDGLYEHYQQERKEAARRRAEGLAMIRQQLATSRAEISAWSGTQRIARRVAMSGPAKALAAKASGAQARRARRTATRQAAEARDLLMAETRTPAWNDWLMAKAQAGDADALGSLRRREARDAQSLGALFLPGRSQEAAHRILSQLKPEVRPNGTVAYRAQDGGMVLDRGGAITMPRDTPGACLVALQVMEMRFAGQQLTLEGDDVTAQTVAALAGVHRATIRFASPGLEAIRAGAERSAVPGDGRNAQEERPSNQNNLKAKLSPILDFTSPGSEDRGAAVYVGTRILADQSMVLLLQQGTRVLEQRASPREVKAAAAWSIGQVVEIGPEGAVVARKRGRGR